MDVFFKERWYIVEETGCDVEESEETRFCERTFIKIILKEV